MSDNTVGVAILSYAHPHHAAGYTHALTHIDGVRVAAVYDEDPARGQAYARQFGVPDHYSDLAPLLQRSDIHAVVVCSATDQHAPLVLAAAEAGKPGAVREFMNLAYGVAAGAPAEPLQRQPMLVRIAVAMLREQGRL